MLFSCFSKPKTDLTERENRILDYIFFTEPALDSNGSPILDFYGQPTKITRFIALNCRAMFPHVDPVALGIFESFQEDTSFRNKINPNYLSNRRIITQKYLTQKEQKRYISLVNDFKFYKNGMIDDPFDLFYKTSISYIMDKINEIESRAIVRFFIKCEDKLRKDSDNQIRDMVGTLARTEIRLESLD